MVFWLRDSLMAWKFLKILKKQPFTHGYQTVDSLFMSMLSSSRNLSFTVLWHGFQYYTTATTNTWAHHYAACCRRFLEQVKKALNTSQQSWQSCLQSNIILAAASMHYCMCSMMTLIIHLSIFCIYTIEDVLWINTFMMKWESWTKCYWWR